MDCLQHEYSRRLPAWVRRVLTGELAPLVAASAVAIAAALGVALDAGPCASEPLQLLLHVRKRDRAAVR